MDMVLGNMDILFLSETKIDDTSPITHFLFTVYIRLDRKVAISQYENIILMGDFNLKPHETILSEFCEI